MPTKKQDPTNRDIYLELGKQNEKLVQIHTQTQKTNGRVTKLETDVDTLQQKQREADIIAKYLIEHPAQPAGKEGESGWSPREKQLVAFITALLAITAALVGTGRL